MVRSGVLHIGLDGLMSIGACVSFVFAYLTGNLFVGLFSAVGIGIAFGIIFGFLTITRKQNQVISGYGIFFLGGGLTSLLYRTVVGTIFPSPTIGAFGNLSIPLLSEIPILGHALFQQSILVYVGIILSILCSIFLYRTSLGLKIRAVGENPEACNTRGISPIRIRYLSVVFGSALAAVGGAFLPLVMTSSFSENITMGWGWICIALPVAGAYDPLKTSFVSLVFGSLVIIQRQLQIISGMPFEFFAIWPYVAAIFLVIYVSLKGSKAAPGALGRPF